MSAVETVFFHNVVLRVAHFTGNSACCSDSTFGGATDNLIEHNTFIAKDASHHGSIPFTAGIERTFKITQMRMFPTGLCMTYDSELFNSSS